VARWRATTGARSHGLAAWLKRQDGRDFQVSVIAVAAAIFAILQAVMVPRLAGVGGLMADLGAPLFSVLSLSVLVYVIAQVFQRTRLGGFTGRWTYESGRNAQGEFERWAVADIGVEGFQITYSVVFFASRADREAFLAGRSITDDGARLKDTGTARGVASDFNVEHLWIMYEAVLADGTANGLLELWPAAHNSWEALDGTWISHRKDNPDGSRGDLEFRRRRKDAGA
jgi:hypothetical protein